MVYLLSSEPVSEGHSDEIADQTSGALLDQFLTYDSDIHCAIETFVTAGQVVVMGRARSEEYVNLQTITRKTIKKIGYTKSEYWFDSDSYGIMSAIREQNEDTDRGMNRANEGEQNIGDQGMMLGHTTSETEDCISVSLDLTHLIMRVLTDTYREGREVVYSRPDSKNQVTIEYNDGHTPRRIHTIVVSIQYSEFDSDGSHVLAKIKASAIDILIPHAKAACDDKAHALFNDGILYYVSLTGRFVIGGLHSDTGLTEGKVIADTYGGKGTYGDGTLSGRGPSKVNRSVVYASRYITKNLATAGISDEILVRISHVASEAKPINVYADTYGHDRIGVTDDEIAQEVDEVYDLRSEAVEKKFSLRNPICSKIAAYGHMKRQYEAKEKTFESHYHETKIM